MNVPEIRLHAVPVRFFNGHPDREYRFDLGLLEAREIDVRHYAVP